MSCHLIAVCNVHVLKQVHAILTLWSKLNGQPLFTRPLRHLLLVIHDDAKILEQWMPEKKLHLSTVHQSHIDPDVTPLVAEEGWQKDT